MKIDRIGFIEFLKGECAIHCDTEKKAIKLFKILKKLNITWCDGDSLDYNGWEENESETIYYYYLSTEGIRLTERDCTTLPIIKM